MRQDAGKKMQVKATEKMVETTGLMLDIGDKGLMIEVIYKNGYRAWFYDNELRNISHSK